jgi:tetraacyldisaccharide-1-P 4'-kinase
MTIESSNHIQHLFLLPQGKYNRPLRREKSNIDILKTGKNKTSTCRKMFKQRKPTRTEALQKHGYRSSKS